MNITCTICSDLFQPSDDIFDTPCGHIFHYVCLTQWLERSRTCPQCRHTVVQKNIQRLYFNFSNDIGTDNPVSLQATIDSLQFQTLLKAQENQKYIQQLEDAKKQNFALLEDLNKITKLVDNKESIIYALKEQARHLQTRISRLDETEKKVIELTKNLNRLQNLQALLNGRTEKDDARLLQCDDPSNLITYISILKSELNTCMKRKQSLKEENHRLSKELTNVKKQCKLLSDADLKSKQQEKELIQAESRILSLEMKLKKHEKSIDVVPTDIDTIFDNTVVESRADTKEKQVSKYETDDLFRFKSLDKLKDKPKLQQTKVPSNLSILSKNKTRAYPTGKRIIHDLNDPDVCPNGLGGHSRIDKFPVPKNKKPRLITSWVTDRHN